MSKIINIISKNKITRLIFGTIYSVIDVSGILFLAKLFLALAETSPLSSVPPTWHME